jgi:methylated-DNA-protein-cysteine methyltransferase-like protein
MVSGSCFGACGRSLKAKLNSLYRRVWSTVAAIPYGRVASYGQIAELSGHSRGARMVARALRHAPDSIELPWHRVLNVRGRISIPRTSASFEEQIRRLARESVPVDGDRVDMARYRWQPELDEMLWGPASIDVRGYGDE